MADDKHFVMGDFYRICDRSGLKIRARKTQLEWNGLMVSQNFWEARQPQDFVKGVADNQTVPMARPRQVNQFLGPLTTTLTANAAAGATALSVASSVRMILGDRIEVMLDTGVYFVTNISGVPGATSLTINPKLPYSASSGNILTDLSAVSTAAIG
ncbi:MAG: hypothetical protein JWP25_4684 [Bradyrhizobium sp.]|nr:hypothetical protein [Bradyrhizobium sp.]